MFSPTEQGFCNKAHIVGMKMPIKIPPVWVVFLLSFVSEKELGEKT